MPKTKLPKVSSMLKMAIRKEHIKVVLPHDKVEIVNISDVHIGEAGCDMGLFKDTLEYARKTKNAYITLNGDMINLATLRGPSNLYYETCSTDEQFQTLVELLAPVKEKILFVTDGNHEARANREIGLTINRILAGFLDIPYCGASVIAKIGVGKRKTSKTKGGTVGQWFTGFWHHTCGGGSTGGAKINRVIKLNEIYPTADFYVGGHSHSRAFFEDVYKTLNTTASEVILKSRIYLLSAGYVKYEGGYCEAKQLAPTPLGPTVITLDGDRNKTSWDRTRIGFFYLN